ncbi:site-specific integrase [Crocinitomicaceae bacterium]|nr:site-specific integrase [Crocinitomicaceae bacterium]
MATIKLVLDTRRKKSNNRYPLVFRITHRSKTCTINAGLDLYKNDWSIKTNFISKRHSNYNKYKKIIDSKLEELEEVILELEDSPFHYSVADIKVELNKLNNIHTFNSYAKLQVDKLKRANRHGNAMSYQCAISSLENHYGLSIQFDQINYALLSEYDMRMRERGMKINAIAAYMRALRAIYNKAIKEDLVPESLYPFNKYKIKQEKTAKRAVSVDDISKVYNLKLEEGTAIWHARNYFMLTFSLIGINFTDLVQLTPDNIKNGRITYRRQKTKKLYDVKITHQANTILDYYKGKSEKYLLPILPIELSSEGDIKRVTKDKLKQINHRLKKIGKQLCFHNPLTTYVARHSWATSAKKHGYSNELIAEALGHGYGNIITSIYLDAFDKENIDEMNQYLCDAVMK